MHVLMASAELTPIVSTGGLGEAVAGLAAALRRRDDVRLDLVIPDHGGIVLHDEQVTTLAVPPWAGWARARHGRHDVVGDLWVIDVPDMARPHPYNDPLTGAAWWDNDRRYFAFSAAVAALAEVSRPDVVHVNDWHTSAVLSLLRHPPATVLTVHNLAYQGNAPLGWLDVLGPRAGALYRYDQTLPLAGGIALADRVVAVSPTYAWEITTPEGGMGLNADLAARGDALVGIRNGIDTGSWDPRVDEALEVPFTPGRLSARRQNAVGLRADLGLQADETVPLVGMVTRLTYQKGVDRLLALEPYLEGLPCELVVLGNGEPGLTAALAAMAARHHGRVAVVDAFDPVLARRIFGSVDLYLMPSRFEPCGLAQMQAMRYGAIPVVTDVGGLRDTVVDADDHVEGTGFRTRTNDEMGVLDALHRAVRAWSVKGRRTTIQKAGMRRDWSWDGPAEEHVELYRTLVGERAGG